MTEKKWKKIWEDFYKENKYTMWWAGEPEIVFFGRESKKRNLNGLLALDFGCGVGRNTIFMRKIGLNAYGIEISLAAVELAKQHANKEKVFPVFHQYDGKKIPYPDKYFDYIVSHGVLDHMTFDLAKKLMNEMYRVLKPGGKCLLSLHSIFDSHYALGEKIDENTFIINWGEVEVGLPQHYFAFYEVKELVSNFKIERIFLHEDAEVDNDVKMLNKTSFWILYLKKEE